jgi:hypothetical protein
LERTTAVDRTCALERTAALQRAGTLNGVGILQRAIALRIGADDRPVVVGIGALEWSHGALRLLLLIRVAVLLLARHLRGRSPRAE